MGFPADYNVMKLVVDKIYFVSDGVRIREAQLIHLTARGFNFVDTKTNKILFKKHFYPKESDRTTKRLTFWIPRHLIIDSTELCSQNDIEIRDTLMAKTTNKERRELIYNWIRKGYINIRQFENLIYYIK